MRLAGGSPAAEARFVRRIVMPIGEIGTLVGLIVALPAGAYAYRRARAALGPGRMLLAPAAVSMLVTAVVATAIFVPMRVHDWLGGQDWRSSAFLAVCFGIVQGILGKDKPRLPRLRRRGTSKPPAGP